MSSAEQSERLFQGSENPFGPLNRKRIYHWLGREVRELEHSWREKPAWTKSEGQRHTEMNRGICAFFIQLLLLHSSSHVHLTTETSFL